MDEEYDINIYDDDDDVTPNENTTDDNSDDEYMNSLSNEFVSDFLRGYEQLSESNNNICSICYDDDNEKRYVKLIDCGHIFHFECIERWKFTLNTCPICRQAIPENTREILRLLFEEAKHIAHDRLMRMLNENCD